MELCQYQLASMAVGHEQCYKLTIRDYKWMK